MSKGDLLTFKSVTLYHPEMFINKRREVVAYHYNLFCIISKKDANESVNETLSRNLDQRLWHRDSFLSQSGSFTGCDDCIFHFEMQN